MIIESKDNTDELIVVQLRDGSKEAFRYLFDKFGPKIHAFALSYLKDKAAAEELLQDVFLKLWEKRFGLDSSRNIKSYLFKICINLIYDLVRRKNIEQAYLSYSAKDARDFGETTWHEVIYNDMLQNLQHHVNKMPEQRRRIFRLSKEEGLSNEEIAKQLNLSRRTVENQLYRAVAFLKDKLEIGSVPALLFFFLHCN